MWKPAAEVIIATMAGATAHAQQQQSPIENLDKTISELAQEGYEIKAAEDLSENMPKFVLQKAESIIICQINFSDGGDSNLGRGGGDGLGLRRAPAHHRRMPSARRCPLAPALRRALSDRRDLQVRIEPVGEAPVEGEIVARHDLGCEAPLEGAADL